MTTSTNPQAEPKPLQSPPKCPTCGGTGMVGPENYAVPCYDCRGSGYDVQEIIEQNRLMLEALECAEDYGQFTTTTEMAMRHQIVERWIPRMMEIYQPKTTPISSSLVTHYDFARLPTILRRRALAAVKGATS